MVYKRVRLIENMNLDLDDRIEVLLLYGEVKSATILFAEDRSNYDPERKLFTLDYSIAEAISRYMKKINLASDIGAKKQVPHEDEEDIMVEVIPVYVGKNRDIVSRVRRAYELYDEEELGICFGYPQTAVDAFMGRRNQFPGDIEDNTLLGYFAQFLLSRDFFQDELETSRKWLSIVEKLSPRMLRELEEREAA